MTNTSKVTITAATLSLLVALGFGYYQANKHEALPDPYTNSRTTTTTTQSTAVPPAAPLDTPPDATANAAPPSAVGNSNPQSAQPPYGTPAPNTAYTAAPAQPVNGAIVNPNNGLTPEVPTSAPLAQSTTTVTQQTVPPQTAVIEKKTVVVEHRPVYSRHIVAHHHKSDKVHVARAAKHATMFAAKLPGRLRL